MTPEQLRALSEFLIPFEKSDFKAGRIRGGTQTVSGIFEMPFIERDKAVELFMTAAYEQNWIRTNFDWMEWTRSNEALTLRNTNGAIDLATPEQLQNLLTVCIREDRFSEGSLLDSFDSGLILRIVRRAAELAGKGEKRMTIDGAAKILASIYSKATLKEKAVSIHLFGIKYAHVIDGMPLKELATRASIPESYATEIRKGINLARYVVVK